MKKVAGVGIMDVKGGSYDKELKKVSKSYNCWANMLIRCYDEKRLSHTDRYCDCSVSDEWLYFSNFKEWYDNNYPYNLEKKGIKIELDKDLMVKGNRIYSKDTCIFIPKKVNSFLTNKQKTQKINDVIGVDFHENKWRSRISSFGTGKEISLGVFDTIIEASMAYKLAREQQSEICRNYMIELGYSKNIINSIK